jgi:hypothetical protein
MTTDTFRTITHIGQFRKELGPFPKEEQDEVEKRLLDDGWKQDGQNHFKKMDSFPHHHTKQDTYIVFE